MRWAPDIGRSLRKFSTNVLISQAGGGECRGLSFSREHGCWDKIFQERRSVRRQTSLQKVKKAALLAYKSELQHVRMSLAADLDETFEAMETSLDHQEG